jgi:antitoxin (DNA-binding transcriptional repressor) of toxin-antitoxin stability system
MQTSTSITATDLARHTRDVLDRVASQGQTIGIARNQTVIAHIVPSPRSQNASQALEGLVFPKLSAQQANAWLADSKSDFDDAVRSPWK